jgi:hypothetical protein
VYFPPLAIHKIRIYNCCMVLSTHRKHWPVMGMYFLPYSSFGEGGRGGIRDSSSQVIKYSHRYLPKVVYLVAFPCHWGLPILTVEVCQSHETQFLICKKGAKICQFLLFYEIRSTSEISLKLYAKVCAIECQFRFFAKLLC